jgi:hypothetical protein
MKERAVCNTTGKVRYQSERDANAAATRLLRKDDAPYRHARHYLGFTQNVESGLAASEARETNPVRQSRRNR